MEEQTLVPHDCVLTMTVRVHLAEDLFTCETEAVQATAAAMREYEASVQKWARHDGDQIAVTDARLYVSRRWGA